MPLPAFLVGVKRADTRAGLFYTSNGRANTIVPRLYKKRVRPREQEVCQ